MMHAHQLKTAEVSVEMRSRSTGQSSINVGGSAYYVVKVLLAVFIGLFRARPTVTPGDDAPVSAERGIG